MNQTLKIISIQSPNAAESCRQIAHHMGQRLGIATEFINDVPWQERDRMLESGEADIGWVCGLPYVMKAKKFPGQFELIAAPVMQQARYHQRPVYFSDVVVRRDSRFNVFNDLRGTRWAYNEPNSQSGYNITRFHLAQLGEVDNFFDRVLEAGSHLNALEMILQGDIEAAAIDSTVLDQVALDRPDLLSQLRVVDTLGPSPIPPWVINTKVPTKLREAIKRVFWTMHMTAAGREVLSAGQIERMVAVSDKDYDRIREMQREAEKVKW